MQLLVAEYTCSGAAPHDEPSLSLVAEGRAMLAAAAADLCDVAGVTVRVLLEPTMDSDFDLSNVERVQPRFGTFGERLRDALVGCDAAFVVAPEFDGLLADARGVVAEAGVEWIGCSAEVISIGADKWRCFEHFRDAGVPTVPTVRADDVERPPWDPPWVVKPRDGAGSMGLAIVEDVDAFVGMDRADRIVQPLVPGAARSVGVVFAAGGAPRFLPVAEQCFRPGSLFEYVESRVPVADPNGVVAEVVRRAVASLPGLGGYVGFDVIVPDAASERPLIVELNPRLTSSYLAYRRVLNDNPLRGMFADDLGRRRT